MVGVKDSDCDLTRSSEFVKSGRDFFGVGRGQGRSMHLEQFDSFEGLGLRGFIQIVEKYFDRRISASGSEEFDWKWH